MFPDGEAVEQLRLIGDVGEFAFGGNRFEDDIMAGEEQPAAGRSA